jgi:hypothetical protein
MRPQPDTSNISLNTVIKSNNQQMTADLGGELAILDLQSGVYYGLDEVGARIWNLLASPRTLLELRDAILAEYNVEPERCEQDLVKLISDLSRHKLVELTHAPTDPI